MDKKKEEQETENKRKDKGEYGGISIRRERGEGWERERERWLAILPKQKKWSPRDQDEESSEDKYKLSTLPKKNNGCRNSIRNRPIYHLSKFSNFSRHRTSKTKTKKIKAQEKSSNNNDQKKKRNQPRVQSYSPVKRISNVDEDRPCEAILMVNSPSY